MSLEELAKGAREFGATLNGEQVQQLFQSLDKDGSGSIDFNELLIALRVTHSSYSLMKLTLTFFILKPPMSKSRIALIHIAFSKMDKNGDGVITAEDLKGVYSVR